MCCGPRLPVESIVTSTLSAFSFLIVTVLLRSGQTLSMTASVEVSFTNRRLQSLSIFCIDFCCSSRLSVQTSIVGIGLPDLLKLASLISAFHWPFCIPLNILGVSTSSAATAAAMPSAKTAAILTAWFMATSPRLSYAYCIQNVDCFRWQGLTSLDSGTQLAWNSPTPRPGRGPGFGQGDLMDELHAILLSWAVTITGYPAP